jgi:glycosyltransferase involved in cell wall biosynthesis
MGSEVLMKKIALICFDNPFMKPMEGGKRGMLSRIEALAECPEYEVDIYLLTKPTELNNKENPLIESDRFHYKRYTILSGKKVLLSSFPISVAKRFIPECASELKKHHYDVAIYEGEHVSEYRVKNCVNADRHILYMHDIESSYRADLARSETVPARRFAQNIESRKYARLENQIAGLFDRFLFVSIDEKKAFENRFPSVKGKCIYTPYATEDFAEDIVHTDNNSQLLYIGNLQLKNNYLSILWFAKKVMPIILKHRKDAHLVVVGNISEENKEELEKACGNISVAGYVPSLTDVINESCCIISPVLFGAGVKVKLIDALSSGQIVVANTKTAEGTELKSMQQLILADTESDFAKACLDVLNDRKKFETIARQGLEFVKKEHSVEHHVELLKKAIEE